MTEQSLLLISGFFAILCAGAYSLAAPEESPRERNMDKELTQEEERVIVHKGTERPFSGKFLNHHEDGTYSCRRCGAALFRSDSKFDSGSGWPSFDSALPHAVKEVRDADGSRTEIVCAACDAHLGHVFRGEGLTENDTRHCVNSVSLGFSPQSGGEAAAYFAGGCFWGVEHHFEQVDGVTEAVSGYMGGRTAKPTYEEVCSKATGHAEVVRVAYDPSKVTYRDLAKLFFEIHDPTQVNRQGPDVGEQYRSAVFYAAEDEKKTILELIDLLEKRGLRVATTLEKAETFWPAEDYHQDYYEKTGKQPYCHTRVIRFEE